MTRDEHVSRATAWAARAEEEMTAGHYDAAAACAALATAHASTAAALPSIARRTMKDPEACVYANNHPYMSEPCSQCGYVNPNRR